MPDIGSNRYTRGRLNLNGSTTSRIGRSGDRDWFRIHLNAGQQVRFDLEGSPTGRGTLSDTYLRGIYNSSGSRLSGTTNDDGGTRTNSRVDFTASSSGYYYVSAGAYSSRTGTYRLTATALNSVSNSSSSSSSSSRSSSRSSSSDIAANTGTQGRLSLGSNRTGNIERSGDQDWFRIHLNRGQRVRFDLEGSPTGRGSLRDTYLRGIYDSSGNYISGTRNDDGGTGYNSRVNFTASSSGYYYVAAGAYGSRTGGYRLTATALNSVSNSSSGSSSRSSSRSSSGSSSSDISANTGTQGRVTLGGYTTSTIGSSGDRDWFRIHLNRGQRVRFDLEGSPTGRGSLRDTYLRGIYDSSGNYISGTRNDDGGTGYNSRVNFTASSSGYYYVAAGAYSGTGTYRLTATALNTISSSSSSSRTTNSTSNRSSSSDISANTGTQGRLNLGSYTTSSIGSNGDRDWFRIHLNRGQRVRFDLEGSPTGRGTLGDTYLRGVYNSSGTQLSGTTNDDGGTGYNSRVNFTASRTGDYYVSAGAYSGTGTYRLTATALNTVSGSQSASSGATINTSSEINNLESQLLSLAQDVAGNFREGVGIAAGSTAIHNIRPIAPQLRYITRTDTPHGLSTFDPARANGAITTARRLSDLSIALDAVVALNSALETYAETGNAGAASNEGLQGIVTSLASGVVGRVAGTAVVGVAAAAGAPALAAIAIGVGAGMVISIGVDEGLDAIWDNVLDEPVTDAANWTIDAGEFALNSVTQGYRDAYAYLFDDTSSGYVGPTGNGVWWATRDLDSALNRTGNHHFLIVRPSNPDAISISMDFDGDGDRDGFVIGGTQVNANWAGINGDLVGYHNRSDRTGIADLEAIGTLEPSGDWNLEFDGHQVPLPAGETTDSFAFTLYEAYNNYQANTANNPVPFALNPWLTSPHSDTATSYDGNCATWVNTILQVAGVSSTTTESISDFGGIDFGENVEIDRNLFLAA